MKQILTAENEKARPWFNQMPYLTPGTTEETRGGPVTA